MALTDDAEFPVFFPLAGNSGRRLVSKDCVVGQAVRSLQPWRTRHSMARHDGMTRRGSPLLQLKDIALIFGGTPLLSGAELSVGPGERVSLVGRNGTGKSTLLKIAAGLVEPDRGSVFVQPGTLVHYLPQEPDFFWAPRRRLPMSRPA